MEPKYLALVLCMLAPVANTQELPADPTRPSGITAGGARQSAPVSKTYVLNYVKATASQQTAIVNGQRVGVGSWVDGARVIQITAGSVRLETDTGVKTLNIGAHVGFNKQKSSRN